jgi:methionyl-tRNA formyltransferase
MKLGFIANSSLALPTLQKLLKDKKIVAIGIPDQLNPDTEQINLLAIQNGLTSVRFERDKLEIQLTDWIIECQLDLVLVFTFPWKIPTSCLTIPANGFYNAHFAPLPQYQGAAPLFWLIKNRERQGGMCIHQMNKEFDKGDIAFQATVPLTSEETLGTHMGKISMAAVQWTQNFLERVINGTLNLQEQDGGKAKYWPLPEAKDLTINWSTQTAVEIKAIVKATNPHYGGAITYYQSFPFRILEVSSVDSNIIAQKFSPGTIINAPSGNGLVVVCKDGGLLKIEVIKLEEGYFSGWKLFELGVRPGTCFSSPL